MPALLCEPAPSSLNALRTVDKNLSSHCRTAAPEVPLLSGRVLHAEDDPINRTLVGHLLRRLNVAVETAEDGWTACEMALKSQAEGRPYDLILMDVQMPQCDGCEATRRLRATGWRGVIIAVTGQDLAEDLAKCLNAGCDDYVSKPISGVQLRELLTRYLS